MLLSPPTMETAAERITYKLWLGILPADEPVKMWGGYGSGQACDGCDLPVTPKDPEHEIEMPGGRILRLHVACAGLWRVLKEALPKS